MGWGRKFLLVGVAVSVLFVHGEGTLALSGRRPVTAPDVKRPSPGGQAGQSQSEKEKADKGKTDKEKTDKEKTDKVKMDKEKTEAPAEGDDSTATEPGAPPAETDSAKIWSTKLWSTKLWSAKLWSVTEKTRATAKATRQQGETGRLLVFVDGERANLAPIEQEGRAMAPIRDLAELLGARVSWDAIGQHVTVTKGETTLIFTVGSAQAVVNGWQVDLSAPVTLQNGRAYGSLRFVAEVLDAHVDYDAETDSVVVVTPPSESAMPPDGGEQSSP
ncbi:MAG TPA: stalk domain-containing protein [Symbiobacteriaceae bacterium]|nr:stalk domain-containing protein [Symbiobacteriaceae bacterium]